MPTSLITGGAGFLGSNLTGALLKRGHRVIVLDNFMVGSRDNLAEFAGQDLEIVEWDIRKSFDLAQDKIPDKIDFVWNLACIASPVHYTAHPIETIETNTLGIPNVLAFALAHGAKTLHTSTSEIYGDSLEHPQKETYWGNVNPRGDHACYKEAKRIGETIVTVMAKLHSELDVRMVRIFNTYGPKMALHDGRMISEFVFRALRNEPLPVDGDGTQTRSTCYVDDLVAGLLAVMDAGEQTRNDVFNLGNPDEHSVREFAEQVIQATGSASTIEHKPARSDDVTRRRPDIGKVQSAVGWTPSTPLATGLARTAEWMRGKL
ncbi:GDP-mannose 4,6-dehydratase [Candidatus Berkelbacteria bacterium]|nr:GDP-mannose 4,6-dehydratase [Candidatus Berkelbacteria bacterium]